jgi:Rrf2 family nitric oxide-sensitive transcriptional repressor
MNLTLFSDYSLRVLMFAALKWPRRFSVADAAQAFSLSQHHLAKVVQNLVKRGDLESWRGRGGGVLLARQPEQVNLGELLHATETGAPLVECFDPAHNRCVLAGGCRLQGILHEANKAFFEVLGRYTLADLTEASAGQGLRHKLGLTATGAVL